MRDAGRFRAAVTPPPPLGNGARGRVARLLDRLDPIEELFTAPPCWPHRPVPEDAETPLMKWGFDEVGATDLQRAYKIGLFGTRGMHRGMHVTDIRGIPGASDPLKRAVSA